MTVDIILLVVAVLCLLLGLVGCVVPALPGPPVSWVALLLLKCTRFGDAVSWTVLIVFAVLIVLITLFDYYAPVWTTKKFGGTRAGMWGTTIGLILGLFFAPVGIIVGPFLGALVGELLAGTSGEQSLKAAFGAFLGFLLGMGFKLLIALGLIVYFCVVLYRVAF